MPALAAAVIVDFPVPSPDDLPDFGVRQILCAPLRGQTPRLPTLVWRQSTVFPGTAGTERV